MSSFFIVNTLVDTNDIFCKDNAPKFLTHQLHVYELLSEQEADRYGFLACGYNLDTFVDYQYKFTGGKE